MRTKELQDLGRMLCPIMKSVSEIGDKWILLILRECFIGYKRFDDFHTNLQVSKSVLTTKLNKMIDLGLLQKTEYKNEGERTRYEYRLTPKGKDLRIVIITLIEWGNAHLVNPKDDTLQVVDKVNRQPVEITLVSQSGEKLGMREVTLQVGQKK